MTGCIGLASGYRNRTMRDFVHTDGSQHEFSVNRKCQAPCDHVQREEFYRYVGQIGLELRLTIPEVSFCVIQ
jgi:hypothetical protein